VDNTKLNYYTHLASYDLSTQLENLSVDKIRKMISITVDRIVDINNELQDLHFHLDSLNRIVETKQETANEVD